MVLRAHNLGKRYGAKRLFSQLHVEIPTGQPHAVAGANGSGKSSLLRLLAGAEEPTEGRVELHTGAATLPASELFAHSSLCSPVLALPELLTVGEYFRFLEKFWPRHNITTARSVIDSSGWNAALGQRLVQLSSGQLQRLKLVTTLLSPKKVLFLDEPSTNLDHTGKAWWKEVLSTVAQSKIVVISSNETEDFELCNPQRINLNM